MDITGKLSKMETEAYDLQAKLEKAEIKPTRGSLRRKTKDLTKDSRAEAKEKLIAQKERLDRESKVLKKRKEFYSKLETGSNYVSVTMPDRDFNPRNQLTNTGRSAKALVRVTRDVSRYRT